MSTDDPDEPRVKDMDPVTMAQLMAWFDRPSFASLDDMPAASAAPPPSEVDEIQARRQKALAEVDPGLLAHVERWLGKAAALQKVEPPDRPWHEGHRITTFDDTALPPSFDPDDAPEVEVPMALRRDLKTCTPQAFLRDLYRPEKEFWAQMRSPWEDEGVEPEASDPMAPVRETLRQHFQFEAVAPALASIASSMADLKGLLAAPWQESKRAPARAREAELLGKLDAAAAVVRKPEEAP